MKSSENLKKTITQETQETNFSKYLEKTTDIREIKKIFKFMRNNFIKKNEVSYISIDDYIYFFKQIPESLWSETPVFYLKNKKFDALGMLGESIHYFNIHSKTLEMYFKDCVGIKITDALDRRDSSFNNIHSNKKRFLKYLEYIKQNSSVKNLKQAYAKSRKIINGRYY